MGGKAKNRGMRGELTVVARLMPGGPDEAVGWVHGCVEKMSSSERQHKKYSTLKVCVPSTIPTFNSTYLSVRCGNMSNHRQRLAVRRPGFLEG